MDRKALEYLIIENTDPKVVAITGSWGIGKTEFWRAFAKQHPAADTAYVSLFRMSHLDQQNDRLASELLIRQDDLEDVGRRWKKTAWEGMSSIGKSLLSKLGIDLPSSFAAEMIIYSRLSAGNTICLDDLERTKIPMNQLMGYVDELRERYRVNVVLIYNQNQLEEQDTVLRYQEKVIDRTLPFTPNIEQCVAYGIEDVNLHGFATERCRLLGLDNIRVIKRADALTQEVCRHLDAKQGRESL